MVMAMVRNCFPLGAATCFAITSTFSSFCSSLDHDRACFLSFFSSKSTLGRLALLLESTFQKI
jgi:hypothetical protein